MKMGSGRILLVDDEAGVRFGIARYLKLKDYEVQAAEDCTTARQLFHEHRPDLCILDHMLPDGTALELLSWIGEQAGHVPVIVLTGHGSIDLAVKAIKLGAEQFLTKPVDLETLHLIVGRTLEGSRDKRKISAESRRASSAQPLDPFLGDSEIITSLRECALRVAKSDSPVLIDGETGTGKTVLARWIHHQSPRCNEPFIDLNCGGLTKEFLESELFGHERGAFTGAIAPKQGLFETAHRGTIFLDEIGDMDLQVQPKVLKVVEENRFRRLGAVRDLSVDVRLIAATHLDLEDLASQGRFRSDLYFRVSALPLRVPALRERPGDIPLLANYFLDILARDLRVEGAEISPAAMNALCSFHWPGNLRELRNVLERALIHSQNGVIVLEKLDLRNGSRKSKLAEQRAQSLEENERLFLEQVIREEGGHVDAAAQRLGVSRSTLYYKIRKLGVAALRT